MCLLTCRERDPAWGQVLELIISGLNAPSVATEAILRYKCHWSHSLFSSTIVLVTACLEQTLQETLNCSS